MASTNKTSYLKLNQWRGTDVPKRQDFVNDNAILDQALENHMEDMQTHLTTTDRKKLNNLFFIESYMGDGASGRIINLAERPSFVIVYPVNYPLGKTEFQGELHFCNFGFTLQGNGSYGLALNGQALSVGHRSTAEFTYEILRFNQPNIAYQIIAFR